MGKKTIKLLESVLEEWWNDKGTRDQMAKIHWMIEKVRDFQKNICFCFIVYAKAFDCVGHKNHGKFFKRWEYQTTWPASCKTCMHDKKQQLEQTDFQMFKLVLEKAEETEIKLPTYAGSWK